MNLSIVVVNYKSRDQIERCLAHVKNSDLKGIESEIFLIDNASGDNLENILKANPEIKFIKSDKNLGMGGGNNLGIRHSRGEFVLILNPDTYPQPDAIKTLYNYIKGRSEIGIIGPKLLNSDGTLQYSCMHFPKFYMPLLRRTFLGRYARGSVNHFLMADYDHNSVRDVDWLMGSSLFIRRSALEKIGGGFDEKFFMYFEDTDLCRRMHEAGYKVIYLPAAIVIHDHARQSAKEPWYYALFTNKLAREHLKSWFKYFLT